MSLVQSSADELYSVSWSNPAWSHLLCAANVLDYFCDLSNPFYDRQCNNEVVRMQRLSSEQLLCMTGVEFYLHHAQEPILFVIRKQQRLSSTQVTPLAYYYIINGTVLQAPDLATLLSSRLLTTVSGLNKVLQTLVPCARYHPSDGSYSWDDPNTLLGLNPETESGIGSIPKSNSTSSAATSRSTQSIPANLFQIQRTDFLLAEWANRFPLPTSTLANPQTVPPATPSTITNTPNFGQPASSGASQTTPVVTIKEEAPTGELHPPSQSRPSVKAPVLLPGVGPNAVSISSSAFSQSPHLDKKPRLL
ncbi:hypothetical protein P879_02281 [Paragonimus westermani]|uniref:Mediator of RNA polymerase II transcription subunit 6 n=1 Tax=Paragonimus westermani TaxID=34504 RepID=A0A8T0DYS4_9TREM|nr:hypothetical protein P879_02281 [Paragonimus westermani]